MVGQPTLPQQRNMFSLLHSISYNAEIPIKISLIISVLFLTVSFHCSLRSVICEQPALTTVLLQLENLSCG